MFEIIFNKFFEKEKKSSVLTIVGKSRDIAYAKRRTESQKTQSQKTELSVYFKNLVGLRERVNQVVYCK